MMRYPPFRHSRQRGNPETPTPDWNTAFAGMTGKGRRAGPFLAALFLLCALALPAAAQDFLPGFEDVPVMRGLTVLPERGHVFDAPSGRLVESYAGGKVSRDAVSRFYRETLAELGWTAAGDGVFRREDETLALDYEGSDGDLTVRFRLSPRQN